MPIFIGDHLAETSDFNATEQGAYCNLLFRLWRTDGLLPLSDKTLAKIARVSAKQWAEIKSEILRLFYATPEGFRHARYDAELLKAKENIEKKRRAGIASGMARKREHVFNTCSTYEQPRAGEGAGDAAGKGSNYTHARTYTREEDDDMEAPF